MDWPKLGEVLFQSSRDEEQLNACVNSYSAGLNKFAWYYHQGAEALARSVFDGDAILDAVIVPIVFLYRQYLELIIKNIIDTTQQIENEGKGYPKHHNLKELWSEAARLIRKHYGSKAPSELDNVQPCIDEFSLHDPESFSFRYPTDKKGKPRLY